MSVVGVLIVLLVMVGILLGANSWISQGVDRSSAIVRRTIPQVSLFSFYQDTAKFRTPFYQDTAKFRTPL